MNKDEINDAIERITGVWDLYTEDLTAMHDAESRMLSELWIPYARNLRKVVNSPLDFVLLHATAKQRAEAFLRTHGKWEDGK